VDFHRYAKLENTVGTNDAVAHDGSSSTVWFRGGVAHFMTMLPLAAWFFVGVESLNMVRPKAAPLTIRVQNHWVTYFVPDVRRLHETEGDYSAGTSVLHHDAHVNGNIGQFLLTTGSLCVVKLVVLFRSCLPPLVCLLDLIQLLPR
jgi:hypothetical protein